MKWSSMALVALVALAACSGPPGPQGPQGEQGPPGTQGATGMTGPAGTFTGTFTGDATITGNLTVTGGITSDQTWVLLHSANLTAAADHTISGLDGNAYTRFRIEADGIIFVGGGDKAIGLRPNGDTTAANYTVVMAYDQHTPGSSVSTAVTGGYGITAANQLPLCGANFNTDCQLTCSGEMRTRTGNMRNFFSEGLAETVVSNCGSGNIGCITRQRHGGAWRNSAANITSLVVTFNTATGFNGTIRLYGRK